MKALLLAGLLHAAAPAPDLHVFADTGAPAGIRFGFIDHTGAVVIPARYEKAWPFHEGLASVRLGGKWGAIDASGALVVPARHDQSLRFSDGLALLRREHGGCNFFEYVDRRGRSALPETLGGQASDFSNGLALVSSQGRRGYMDKSGKVVIPIAKGWEDWEAFAEGLASVKVGGKWGFINNRGRMVIAPRFEPPGRWKRHSAACGGP